MIEFLYLSIPLNQLNYSLRLLKIHTDLLCSPAIFFTKGTSEETKAQVKRRTSHGMN